ncbi:ABC transporter permease subunit [Neisseriaceae bacterium PsAf]|nr:ABC transporter permease subunit [Neisseriaceae bacterium PsAf]
MKDKQSRYASSSWFLKTCLVLGLLFLYLPLIILIVYSFNDSKLVTVWGGFTTKWYSELLHNEVILNAAWLSLKIAIVSSASAVILGVLAGYALERIKFFKGSTLFAGMVNAPMMMPEVISGLSMLMLIFQTQILIQTIGFESFRFERGFFTIWLAHTTMIMAYVTVIIRARLSELDDSLEEAAMDLGARPLKIFFVITLPMILPAIVSGFVLGFTLSFDDLVIATFVSGPDSVTLPQIIFSKIRRGLDPQMNVLATIMLVVVGTLVIGGNYLLMKKQVKNSGY